MVESEAAPEAELFPKRVGDRLREARVAQEMELADIAQRTRIPQRHLESIETSNFSALPSPTYAMGFAKAYARSVGIDEVELARDLRAELDATYERPEPRTLYDTSDPARVPPSGLALAGVVVAVLLLIGVGIWYGTGGFGSGEAEAPPAGTVASAPGAAPAAVQPPPVPAPTGGQVTLTATDEVWVRVYDADNETLFMKTMQPGERYDVPMNANDPMINVGRPGKLTVTINGSEVPPLGPPAVAIKDVRISAEALRARDEAGGTGADPADAAGEGG